MEQAAIDKMFVKAERNAKKVISLFKDAYGDTAGTRGLQNQMRMDLLTAFGGE